MSASDWSIEARLAELREQDLWRELHVLDSSQGAEVTREGRRLVNFSSNDYLGLAAHPAITTALHEGIERFGAGAGASRLVCGTQAPHAELESALAAFKGTEAALAFSSGHAVALGTIPALMGRGDTILLDKLCHACLVDAARLSGATIRVFPHQHLGKLERLLQTAAGRVLVVTESVFSMDGDITPLKEIVELKDRHGAWLLMDEAHGVGVLGPQGRGLAAQLGLEARVELQMGTLSKALGLSGGYLAASRAVIDLLVNRARSFIYSTAPPPCIAHAARAAVGLISGAAGDELRHALWENLRHFTQHMRLPEVPESAIVPWIVGAEAQAVDLSRRLLERGFLTPAIRHPTVARGAARLRLTFSAAHTSAQITALAAALRAEA